MTNEEMLGNLLTHAASLVKQGRLDEVILATAKSAVNNSGGIYDLFCDGEGTECSCEEQCSDQAMLCCIRRFLARDVPV